MNRREFITLVATVPFGGITFGKTISIHPELMPHRLFLPATTWEAIGFASQVTRRCRIIDGVVTNADAQTIAKAINANWDDLPWHFRFYLGIDPNDDSEQFLLGDGWQRRVRVAEAFFRVGPDSRPRVPKHDGTVHEAEPERFGGCCGQAELLTAHYFFSSTSFQNSAAGFLLIVSNVLMERSSSVSRSGLKSQLIVLRGISLIGERS